jgi:ATP-dependent exoDNAse (exonuclease V) alpha subunit
VADQVDSAIHTAQGSTAPEHILALPGGSQSITGEAGYVGATRHRLRSFILTSEQAERRDIAQRRPLNDTRPIGAEDAWANVARHMLPGAQTASPPA